MKKHDIAIIGTFPPPIGGVSVHIERLTRRLRCNSVNYILYNISKKQTSISYNISNIRNLKLWLIIYFLCCRDKVIHCQERNWYLVLILCLIKNIHKSKLMLTLHSFRENPQEFDFFKRYCFLYCLKNVDMFIAVGENEKSKLIKLGCSENKITVIPAYITPQYNESDDNLIPQFIWDFMKKNDFNIVANASRISFYNNEDLYGIDMCIELCSKLKERYFAKKIGFIFCLPNIDNNEYHNKLKQDVNEMNISNEFLFVNEVMPLYPLLKKSNLFLRPTNTDSYGVSIAEALYFKVPSVASDVCKRPDGTIVFKSRDIDDLYRKTIDVIENYDSHKEKLMANKQFDNAENLISLYKILLS